MENVKNAVEFIIKNLVEDETSVRVTCAQNGDNVDCQVIVSEADIGKVIGRNGKVANAIRMVVRTIGKKNNFRVNIKIDKE